MQIYREAYNAEQSRRQNELGQWLKQARQVAGMNQKELAAALEAAGVSVSGGCVSKWETGDHIPTPYQLYALCEVLGDDCPLLGSSLLSGFNELGRKKISAYIADLRATGLYRQEKEKKPFLRMKIFTLPASAGMGLALEGEDYDWQTFPAESVPQGTEFGIRVRGDSMMPRFRDGQTVWVRRQKELREGEIGIFVLDGEAFIKQLQYDAPTARERESYGSGIGSIAVLNSLNPKYEPRRVSPTQRLDLVGKVLE